MSVIKKVVLVAGMFLLTGKVIEIFEREERIRIKREKILDELHHVTNAYEYTIKKEKEERGV